MQWIVRTAILWCVFACLPSLALAAGETPPILLQVESRVYSVPRLSDCDSMSRPAWFPMLTIYADRSVISGAPGKYVREFDLSSEEFETVKETLGAIDWLAYEDWAGPGRPGSATWVVRYNCSTRCARELVVGKSFDESMPIPDFHSVIKVLVSDFEERGSLVSGLAATIVAWRTHVDQGLTPIAWPLNEIKLDEPVVGPLVLDPGQVEKIFSESDGRFGHQAYEFVVGDYRYEFYLTPWLPGEVPQ